MKTTDTAVSRIKRQLDIDFIYDEYGAGARLLIPNPDGEPWLFADFENHLDAEAFLELIEWLRTMGWPN